MRPMLATYHTGDATWACVIVAFTDGMAVITVKGTDTFRLVPLSSLTFDSTPQDWPLGWYGMAEVR